MTHTTESLALYRRVLSQLFPATAQGEVEAAVNR